MYYIKLQNNQNVALLCKEMCTLGFYYLPFFSMFFALRGLGICPNKREHF